MPNFESNVASTCHAARHAHACLPPSLPPFSAPTCLPTAPRCDNLCARLISSMQHMYSSRVRPFASILVCRSILDSCLCDHVSHAISTDYMYLRARSFVWPARTRALYSRLMPCLGCLSGALRNSTSPSAAALTATQYSKRAERRSAVGPACTTRGSSAAPPRSRRCLHPFNGGKTSRYSQPRLSQSTSTGHGSISSLAPVGEFGMG